MAAQTSQGHAAQIAKLKMAKDEADAKRVQMQKELKEEMESLKTQYIFKVSTPLRTREILTSSPATRVRSVPS